MQKIRHVFRQSFTAVIIFLMVGMFPAPVFAEDISSPPSDTAATQTQPASDGPTGPDAATYHLNSSTGLWENDYYTYDPSTKVAVPKEPCVYTYNDQSKQWDTQIWQFNTTSGAYEHATISVPEAPGGAKKVGGPSTNAGTDSQGADNTSQDLKGQTPSTVSATPADAPKDTSTSTTNNTTDVAMHNTIGSTAQSGNGSATNNDNVGSVGTGNGLALANVVNLLQSQASFSGAGLATFTTDIQGNVSGDLLIDPASFGQTSTLNPNTLNNAKITNITTGSIVNDINLVAGSGNAAATNNDNVGSIKSGNADAIANVINMINSVVAANQSFLGVINIYGDYTGNILMPADSLNALLSSASPVDFSGSSNTNVVNSNDTSIGNNVTLSAATGTATAKNNDNVGSLATGNAMTNLTILNLTGHQITAANSLLVFVNVLGTWVGLIMDAPAGATTAALGGGVSGNATLAADTQINNTQNAGIVNNITAAAKTGNATATNNNDVGSVGTGNATASANIANLVNSSFSLSNWFGILFINVFGAWHGNFGVVKPPVVAPITSGASGPASGGSNPITDMRVFAFVPHASTSGEGHTNGAGSLRLAPLGNSDSQSGAGGTSDTIQKTSAVLGATHTNPAKQHVASSQAAVASHFNPSFILLAIAAAGFGFVGIERVRSNLRNRYTVK